MNQWWPSPLLGRQEERDHLPKKRYRLSSTPLTVFQLWPLRPLCRENHAPMKREKSSKKREEKKWGKGAIIALSSFSSSIATAGHLRCSSVCATVDTGWKREICSEGETCQNKKFLLGRNKKTFFCSYPVEWTRFLERRPTQSTLGALEATAKPFHFLFRRGEGGNVML